MNRLSSKMHRAGPGRAACMLGAVLLIMLVLMTPLMAGDAATARHAERNESASGCRRVVFEEHAFIACRFMLGQDDIRLFHADDDGQPLYSFATLKQYLRRKGLKLRFAMNGGMYTPRYAPAGLYVENGRQVKSVNLRKGRGNFHLLPNGVFWIRGNEAGVWESHRFAHARMKVDYATQSGPMLVIDGHLHPRFRAGSTSRRIRNGVGVMKDGRTVWLALSEEPVTFHRFARFFCDVLKTPNALFLDGTISQIYAPELDRYGRLLPMGPMIAVVVPVTAPSGRKHAR